MLKKLSLLTFLVFSVNPMEQDLEAGRQISPHQQQINERLAHLRALVHRTMHPTEVTPRTDETLEAITSIEQIIMEALQEGPQQVPAEVAQQAGRMWNNIQNPRAKAGVGLAVAGLLVLANQWLSCTVEK